MSLSHTLTAIQPPSPTLADIERARNLFDQRKPNRRDLAKLRTLAKVKEAARFLFVNVGYEATTIRDLAARIGMSTGAVFSAFPEGKDQIWAEVMACPPPSMALAEEVALMQALRPDWVWLIRWTGTEHLAETHGPRYSPFKVDGPKLHVGRAASPAEALRQARIDAERHDGRRAQ
ncbi:helix-turn-helix domain-containing protein [Brevundimonas sp.]|uniref:helix-turn-helix domain-containing protein n=1 Tax=Brevundimonas sp. TaxID=1871086 RepID=UPI00286C72B0|nr:helix-turn-helix domain-containing protein [Brevundimonas sp.]